MTKNKWVAITSWAAVVQPAGQDKTRLVDCKLMWDSDLLMVIAMIKKTVQLSICAISHHLKTYWILCSKVIETQPKGNNIYNSYCHTLFCLFCHQCWFWINPYLTIIGSVRHCTKDKNSLFSFFKLDYYCCSSCLSLQTMWHYYICNLGF